MSQLYRKCVASGFLVAMLAGSASADDRFWNNPDDGLFGEPTNWDDGAGPAPGVGDSAIFDLAAVYTVSFLENQITDRAVVRRGFVTFDLAKGASPGYRLLNPLASTPSIAVAEDMTASLTLAAGACLRGEAAVVGLGVGAAGTLSLMAVELGDPGAELRLDQHLHVGLEGDGVFEIAAGASAENTGATLGVLPGATGTATLSGGGATWDCAGSLIVGEKGTGAMTIEDGADVTSNGGIIGQQPGALGDVTISGLGSSWLVFDSLDIGMRGTGRMTLEDGASLFNLGFATIGSFPTKVGEGGLGTVRVEGGASSWSVQGDLWVGFLANGTLILSRGGQVDMDGNLFRAVSGATSRIIVELGGPFDYVEPALLAAGFTDGFEPRIKLVDGYVPEVGARFEIVQAGGGVGPFAFDLPELSAGLVWHQIVDFAGVAIEVATPCIAYDIDESGQVDFGDVLAVLAAWGECPGCEIDIDFSGAADFGDVLLILGNWGSCP